LYWVIIAIIILVLFYYFFLKKSGDLDFWKLAAKFPDEALDMYEKEDCWIVFTEEPDGGYKNAFPEGDWDGPLTHITYNPRRMYTVFGKIPDYHESQKRFMKQYGNR